MSLKQLLEVQSSMQTYSIVTVSEIASISFLDPSPLTTSSLSTKLKL